MSTDYDVIVVGAGPAGSVCARILGMSGVKVLLIDRSHFPRNKTCGDFVSARLCDKLKQLGLYNAIEKIPHAIIEDLLFSHPSVGDFCVKESLNRQISAGFVCKREDLDAVFFNAAKDHVDVLEGVRIKKLLVENGQVTGVHSENATFRAKVVIGADGANGVTAKALGLETLDENHNAVAIRTYYKNIKNMSSSVELHFLDSVQPGYFWIFPLNHKTGEANVGLGILSRNVRNRRLQLKQLLEKIIKEHPQFRDRFADAQCLSPIQGWSLPFGSKKRSVAFAGALLIGDAAGLIDPMSGEGIENAVRSAECAANIILQALIANDFSSTFLMKYEKTLERLLRPELRKGYWIQKLSRNPVLLKLLFLFLKHSRSGRRVIANKFF